MTKIEILVRDYGREIGLSRYTRSLVEALSSLGIQMTLVRPEYPWTIKLVHALLSPFNYDVKTFFTTYPVQAQFTRTTLKHLTSQQMATIIWLYPNLIPVVITVHDIVPYMVKGELDQNGFKHHLDKFFDRQAMRSLKKATAIIAVSNYTKMMLAEDLGCQKENIYVTYEGVCQTIFRQQPLPQSFFDRYSLESKGQYFLYVGSDNPRKNLPRLLQAFSMVYKTHPEARLIKVGTSENRTHYKIHREMIGVLGLEQVVRWLDQVPEGDLPLFYNLAKCFIFPSLYEGFGLPVLEAMACGTPVVTSNTSSLPEVAGDAALLVDSYDVDAIAAAMRRVIDEPALAQELRQKGLARASQFTWEKTARETIAVYEKVLGEKLL